jgi:hypothetical protein
MAAKKHKSKCMGTTIKKIIILILASLLYLSCAHQDNLTEEEREKYRRAYQRYHSGQTP